MPIEICFSSGCARYHGWPPRESVAGSAQRGAFFVTENSGAFQSMSVYGLKWRAEASERVARVATYSASSLTSMLRFHRLTVRVQATSSSKFTSSTVPDSQQI